MKVSLKPQSVSRHDILRVIPVCNTALNAAQRLYALRFPFFAFYFTYFPICKNCSR